MDRDSFENLDQFLQCPDNLDVHVNVEPIDLSPVEADGSSVLVIGQPQSSVLEIQLVKLLTIDFPGLNIFLKPHPLYGDSSYKEIFSLVTLVEKDFFPEVDVAVCYESTLGTEYEQCGIPVVWWGDRKPMDISSQLRAMLNAN
ncbi:hypothetical protein GCM10007071_24940 [Marinobacter zhanjiangensis]|uniref:CDP-Glycerol:Poly(Glycerophosphate) glycerophosphotransferase n=1 Tax=Marinobacter zhanjiangensis TaxID=578215 RepID=A0ABQ3B2N3_9GAMM|nr:hypothetical protein GCM10007071_24940 [Marinobacter zhanjiangensis]